MESKIVLIDTDFAWERLTGNLKAVEFMSSLKPDIYAMSSITAGRTDKRLWK
jgi:hypothetical protein